jgi:TRAP-type transport system periplasmic protein
MKIRHLVNGLSAVALSLVVVFFMFSPAQAQVVWKFQSLLNPGHMAPDAELQLATELEKRTQGKFKIEVFTGTALGFAGPRILGTVGPGIVESAECWGPHVSGDLRIMEIVALHGLIPYDVPLRKKIVEAVLPYQEKALMQKFNIKPLWEVQVDPRCIYTKKPVQRLSDFKGMKIRSEGLVENEFTKAIGATPLTLAWGDIYTSLQQGVIDGYWVTHTGTFNAKFYEYAKHCLELNISGSPTFFLVNLDKWKALAPEYQKILIELAEQGKEYMNGRVVSDVAEFKKKLQDVGMTFHTPHPDDMKFINEVAPKIWDQWLQGAEPEAKEMLAKIKTMVSEWEKTRK